MRRRFFSEIKNSRLLATDGLIGKVDDLLIQDDGWHVRYLVVHIGSGPPRRKVLISAAAIQDFDVQHHIIALTLKSQHVMDSPPLHENQPISRPYEEALVDYYGWPIYWLGRTIQLSPQTMGHIAKEDETDIVNENQPANLRSVNEIRGYRILAENGDAGFVKDLVIDLDSWTADFATAEPSNWLSSASSMFSTDQIQRAEWAKRQITVNLRRDALIPKSKGQLLAKSGRPWNPRPLRPATRSI